MANEPNQSPLQNEASSPAASNQLAVALESRKRMKKMLIRVLLFSAAVLALLFIGVLVLQQIFPAPSVNSNLNNIYFYPPYEGDIFENQRYLGLNPEIVMYRNTDSDAGASVQIHREQTEKFDATVFYLCDWIELMKRGDVDGYNACFNSNYFQTNAPQAKFSQQMIYDAEIRFSKKMSDQGDTLFTYRLHYRIYRNDGTLRDDVGSGAIVPQTVVLRVSPNGDISIESLIP